MKNNYKYKICPDLIGYEDIKPLARSSDWESARVPVLKTCVLNKCVAYKNGRCMKYDNEIGVKDND